MKLRDWDEKGQENKKGKRLVGKGTDGSGEDRNGREPGGEPSAVPEGGRRKPGGDAASEDAWEDSGSYLDGEYEGSGPEGDLESEEWEELPGEPDEESQWDGTGIEDAEDGYWDGRTRPEGSEDGHWDGGMRSEGSEAGRRDRRMPEQNPEEDERWEESELDFKPGVSYRWKKFHLDSEPDAGGRREETDSEERTERRGMPEGQNPNGAHTGHSGKGAPAASRRGQKRAEEEESWEEELPPLKPWTKVLIFIGLAVVAAIICGILWRFAHPERPEGSDGQDVSSQATESLDDSAEEAPKLDLDAPGEGGSLSGLVPEGTDPDSGTAGGTGTEPGAASGADEESEAAGSGAGEGAGTTSGTDTEPGAGTAEPGDGTGAGGESITEPEGEGQEPVAGTEGMAFQDVQESVTPKDVVNLRKTPNTADADSIVAQARNGEVLARIGINPDTGWSKIDYNGQTLYAVSQYLTTELSYRPAVQPADPNRVGTVSGRIIIFENCDDWISPKEYVNLRTEPSTTEGDVTVSCQLNYGEKVHRTGYSTDSGWSRVEYNGQVLYVVTSLMYVVPAE